MIPVFTHCERPHAPTLAPTPLMLPPVASGPITVDVVHHCKAETLLAALPDASVDLVVTSPPYYWQRDYGYPGQLGHEVTPEEYIGKLLTIFAEVGRILKPAGIFYLNIADTYYSGNGQPCGQDDKCSSRNFSRRMYRAVDRPGWDIPKKSLIGIPWKLALAMQQDGWTLRSDIIWRRPNAFTDSHVVDRPKQTYEHVFMFSKSRRYFYAAEHLDGDGDIWTFNAESTDGHSAAYPEALAKRCILTGCPPGGLVLDPFIGSGTTAVAAKRLGRHYIGCDQSAEYVRMARSRIDPPMPLFTAFTPPLVAADPRAQAAEQMALGM